MVYRKRPGIGGREMSEGQKKQFEFTYDDNMEIQPSRHNVRISLEDCIKGIKHLRVASPMTDSELLNRLLNFVETEVNLDEKLKVICDSCGTDLTYTLVVKGDQIHAMTEHCGCC